MNDEAIRLLRQIRTCCILIASLATFTFAWWFGPIVWNSFITNPLGWLVAIGTLAIAVFTLVLIVAIRHNTKLPSTPPTL